MAFDLSSLSVLGSSLSTLIPSSTDIISNVALGAATSVVLAGLKSSAGESALDPLGLFHSVQPANNPNAVVGPTITASAFAALPAATQAQLTASGVHIIAG
jgi:hypothetical protein